ncbi:gliding motility protein GldG [Minicystis rosea]|nr:gliding motility protein GldG [Minicystis rosea]
MERKTKARAETGIYLLVVAAILVVANLVSVRAYKRIDVTKNERYSLSKGSARLVAEGLTKDLDVTLYVTRGLPKHEAFIQDLTDLMNEYERAAAGRMHYTIVEPKTDEERAKAKEDGMQEAAFGEGSKTGKDQALISKGFMGISFKYGSEKEAIPIMSPEQAQGLEFWITNKIREIRDRADNRFQKIGIVTGKDEIKLSEANLIAAGGGRGGGPTMKGIMEQALPFYKFEDVDLQGGEAEINKELVGLIITQPGKDFTEKELRRIDQFLMQGNKAVAIFASAVNLKASDAAMKAELNLHGLDKLLDGYGVEMKKDAVFDWARPAVVRVMTQGMPVVAGHPATVLTQYDGRAEETTQFLDQSFPGFFRMEELVFPFPSTLVTHADKQPGATVKIVARTTPRSTAVAADTVEMKPARGELKPKGEYGQRAIAVAVEGKLKSAFAGKADGIEAPAESKDKSRLLVVSSSQFLANPYARSGNAPPMPPQLQMMGPMGGDEELMMLSQPYAQQYLTGTILAFKNTLDWMGGDSDLIAASAKLIGEPNLTYLDIQKPKEAATDAETAKRQEEETAAEITKVQQRVQWTMTLFPALLFALFGIVRWRLRESARSAITLD